MPWKVAAVSEVRFALCHAVRTLHRPVAAVAREFGVSRKTAHKWLDVFDALGSRRCYKEPWTHERIRGFLQEQRGRKFDPLLVDCLFACWDEAMALRDQLPD